MDNQITVRPGPEEYICQSKILKTVTERLKIREFKRVMLVHGEKSWEQARPYLKGFLKQTEIECTFVSFEGECSYDEVSRIQKIASEFTADAIIGVGGGKIMDTVKYAAVRLPKVYAVLIPTLASNCAPWTPLSVMYTPEGEFIGHDIHHQQASLLLVDPDLILSAPVNYFIAGIADTLAKWYESDLNLSILQNNSVPLQIARFSAKSCKEIIEKYAIKAVQDAREKNNTKEYRKLVETIIVTSGLVGGFGDELARTTAAHSIHDGLTIFPEIHHFLHGEKVAYGVLVQLALDMKWKEFPKVAQLFQSLSLPICLKDLGLTPSKKLYQTLANSSIEHDPGIFNLPYKITEGKVAEAIEEVEHYFTS